MTRAQQLLQTLKSLKEKGEALPIELLEEAVNEVIFETRRGNRPRPAQQSS